MSEKQEHYLKSDAHEESHPDFVGYGFLCQAKFLGRYAGGFHVRHQRCVQPESDLPVDPGQDSEVDLVARQIQTQAWVPCVD